MHKTEKKQEKTIIPFNRPALTGNEISYIEDCIKQRHFCGGGKYTHLCTNYFESKYNVSKALLTTSCTDALEMAALLIGIKPGDEVIVPSYTFVSSALVFARQGAKILWAESLESHPCMNISKIEELITPKTKAIVPVHYAGVACDMDALMNIANAHNLWVIEDAAQCIDSYYKGKPLGTIGHLGCFSFHETKNIQCGEGGMICINDPSFIKKSEILLEKGTNRSQFFRGEIDKYGWVDTGSSFLPSEITAAFLWAQFEKLSTIQKQRIEIWKNYHNAFQKLENIVKPYIPNYATVNGHNYYLVCNTPEDRTSLIHFLKEKGITASFHYQSLHQSIYAKKNQPTNKKLLQADRYTDCLVRLPLFYDLNKEDQKHVIETVLNFFEQ